MIPPTDEECDAILRKHRLPCGTYERESVRAGWQAAIAAQPAQPSAGTMDEFAEAAALVSKLAACKTNGEMLGLLLMYRKDIRAAQPERARDAAVIVSGPTGCGKSFVMELIYRALREAGLHPYSDDLAHERRLVDAQPKPATKVWRLMERNTPLDAAPVALPDGDTR